MASSSRTEDAAALERVRNRLASSPDSKIPQILSKLLPRLVTRFFAPAAAAATATVSDGIPPPLVVDVDPNLVGILEHVRERILLNPTLIHQVWAEPLLRAVALPQNDAMETSHLTASSWIRQLQYTLPILELALPAIPDVSFLAHIMTILESLHTLLPVLWRGDEHADQNSAAERSHEANEMETQNEDAMEGISDDEVDEQHQQGHIVGHPVDDEEDDGAARGGADPVLDQVRAGHGHDRPDRFLRTREDHSPRRRTVEARGNENSKPHILFLHVWGRASWMVVEEIAKASNLKPVLDWNFLGNDWDEFNACASLKKIEDYAPTQEEQNAAQSGTFYLLLDAIAFDPSVYGNTFDCRWHFRRQTESIQEDFVQAQRLRNAEDNLARANQTQLIRRDVSRRQNPTAWNEAELRYWRGIQRCLRSYSVKLYSRPAEASERENILRIVTGQLKPPSALPMYNRIKPSEMKKVNVRKKANAAAAEQARPICSLAEETALLHLILGDARAKSILDKHRQGGASQQLRHQVILGSSLMALRPLPQGMAQRVFGYLLRADLDLSGYQNGNSDSSLELDLYIDLLYESKTAPSLQVQVSAEVYERIGAHTPPSMCWPVNFLWKLAAELSRGGSHCPTAALVQRGYSAAIELLDMLQDISVQWFEREQRLNMERNSHNRRIHEHREKSALRSPFVLEALQARSEAYQMVNEFMTEDKIMSSLATGEETQLSWNMAARILNCMAFDTSKHTVSARQQACMKVLSVYRQALRGQENKGTSTIPSINSLLLPLLKACISSSDWSRGIVIQWAVDVIFHIDPCISQTILACLSSDEVPHIALKATEALQRLSFPVQETPLVSTISYWDLEQTDQKNIVLDDMRRRIATLADQSDGVSTRAAVRALQENDFSVEAAHEALVYQRVEKEEIMDLDQDVGSNGNTMCEVCWDEITPGKGFALQCQHRFCSECWQAGLEAAADAPSFKDLANFTCLHHDCTERVLQEDVKEIAPPLAPAMEEATLKWFMLSSPDYTFCPGPDCAAVASRQGATSPQQQADCKLCETSFCFDCGSEPHAPVSCNVRRKYRATSERVEAHEDSVENKTIACPSCGMGITKNGGCNHMTCSQCGHEFCWICLSANWQDHVCNVFDSLTGVDDVQRFQFFRRRVDTHNFSADATRRLLDDFENQAQELKCSPYCKDAHVYILKEAWQMLVTGRKYLANSYIAAYGMTEAFDASLRSDFQSHQSQLQLFVEQLSFLSDSVPSLCQSKREEDFQVRFRGLHFCTVAVAGYIQRVESVTGRHFS